MPLKPLNIILDAQRKDVQKSNFRDFVEPGAIAERCGG